MLQTSSSAARERKRSAANEVGAPRINTDTERMRMLIEFSRDLITIHDLNLLLEIALERAIHFSGYEGGSVLLLRAPDGPIEVRASAGAEAVPIGTVVDDPIHSVAGRTIAERRPLVLEGRGEAIGTAWRSYTRPIASVICLPLIIGDSAAIGVLALKSPARIHTLNSADIEALQMLAAQLAAVIENARLHEERNQLIARLASSEHDLRSLVGQLLTVQEEERRRLTCELHDGLAQLATGVHQHLQAFAGRYRPRKPQTRQAFNQLLNLAQRTVAEARRLMAGLRPAALDDFGLAAAIRLEASDLCAAGWDITFDLHDTGRLHPDIETALFRLAQEALTNVRKHAGVPRAHILLMRHEHCVRLEVRDWGRGFDPTCLQSADERRPRFGLIGMRERVDMLHGSLFIESSIGGGTRVVVEIPLPADRAVLNGS